jgi:hypothetical protein
MHKVHVFSSERVITHEFNDAMEAVRFYYLSQISPTERSHIELTPHEFDSFEFMPPKVISFSGTFVSDYFVGSLTLEASDGTQETIEGVFYANEFDFGRFALTTNSHAAQLAITNLTLSGAKKVGRNDDTSQTFLLLGDNMIAVDDLGQMKVAPTTSSWNEAIDDILYKYEFPFYDTDEERLGF